MKKIILLVFLFLETGSWNLQGQSIQFLLKDSIPVSEHGIALNNPWAGGINSPLFSEIDLNGDGIHDLFLYDKTNGRISTFINDGTPGLNAWHYAPQYISKFPPLDTWAVLFDYNCDGKADLFTLAPSHSGMMVYRNDFDSAQGGLRFTLVAPEIMEAYSPTIHAPIFVSAVSMPTFGDVDGDGDMDILGFSPSPDGRVVFNKNYSMEDYGVCDSLDFKYDTPTWGSFAVSQLSGGNAHVGCFSCRRRVTTHPKNPLDEYDQSIAAPRDDSFFSIFMIDIDGDGDKDLLIGDSGADNTLLVVNGKTTGLDSMTTQDISFPTYDIPADFCTYHYHAYIDVDNDGVKDLIVEPDVFENKHNVWFYKNNGTNSVPVFARQSTSFLVDQMIDVGEGASPVLFDADGDGLQDLVIGNYGISDCSQGTFTNSLRLYRNTGTLTSPSFELVDSDYAGVGQYFFNGHLYPAFGDMDGDGRKDLIIGADDGKLQYFENTGGSPANFSFTTGLNYMGINVGNASAPQIVDLNRDSLPDLVIGAQDGHIIYFENAGTVNSPFFSNTPTNATLGGIIIHSAATNSGHTVPFIFDDHGSYKLLVSSESGEVYLYDSIDGNLNGNFHLLDSVVDGTQGVRASFNLTVSGGDLNNDGLTDMLLGIYGGGVCVYFQKDLNNHVVNSAFAEPVFVVGPNPSGSGCSVQLKNYFAKENYQLNVRNYTGQIVLSEFINEDHVYIDTRNYAAGIYMLQLVSEKFSVTKKLVVSH